MSSPICPKCHKPVIDHKPTLINGEYVIMYFGDSCRE